MDFGTRNDFLQYYHHFTLDPNTVNKHLRLSENNRVITHTDKDLQQYPDHPDRFDHCEQVLCKESVCGRCYWEIEWRAHTGVEISVSYKSISRKGGVECWFGRNDQSWSLGLGFGLPSDRYSVYHKTTKTDTSVESIHSSKVGVFVDPGAGILSFYDVSRNTMIDTVQTTFTQPLYPGFSVCAGSVELLLNQN